MCYDQVKTIFLFKGLMEATCMKCVYCFFLCVARCLLCQHLGFLSSKNLEETTMCLCLVGALCRGVGGTVLGSVISQAILEHVRHWVEGGLPGPVPFELQLEA